MKRYIIEAITKRPVTILMILTAAIAAGIVLRRVIGSIMFVMEMDR